MTDTDEATVLITGATDGLGRRVAYDLVASGATVLLHGRDEERVEPTLREIRKETNNDKLRSYQADFSSLGEVRRLAEEVRTNHAHLDVLVNNAGVFARERAVSRDGHELIFAVSFLSPFLLTYLLVPLLRGSAPARGQRCIGGPKPSELRRPDARAGLRRHASVCQKQAGPRHVHLRPSWATRRHRRYRKLPAPGDAHGYEDGLRGVR